MLIGRERFEQAQKLYEHELEIADLKEVLLQSAVYAGVPAANTAFHIAAEEVAGRGADPGDSTASS